MRTAIVFLGFCLICGAQQDPAAIVRKSVVLDKANAERARNYVWTQKTIEKNLDSAGKVEKVESKTEEMTVVGGEQYRRLVARNDKPISAAEQKKEHEKQERTAAERAKVSEAEKAKRRERQRAFLDQIPEAYNFKLLQDDVIDGRPVWVIEATPKPGYKGTSSRMKMMSKLRGKLWIDKADYLWVKVDCESIEPVSFGLFLAKLNPGAHIFFEQTRVNDEVWLPKRVLVQVDARLLVARKRIEIEQTSSNYKRFQVDSKIQAIAEKK